MADDVDAWMAKYENPQKPLVEAVRQVVLKADKRMTETIKWQAPTFVYKGNLASFYPKSKAHVSLMFHTGAQIPGDFPSLQGTGDVSRVMKFLDAADLKLKAAELGRLVRAWCDLRDRG
ncbi:hypothetical protein VW23_018335 [Devosia insulae DS-56]|uniref:YdhG-like domain-containing protein n=1 Tax=Devosia insulae DS-56 TaxID=1116389 RepID=A0A1E5XR14_9HYPH|nr:DUF1801 domain-containing protein [Devosia insulae]OEO31047.1 hypothetical protein VW23_018335 [Devosia insulae DS-56]